MQEIKREQKPNKEKPFPLLNKYAGLKKSFNTRVDNQTQVADVLPTFFLLGLIGREKCG